MNVEVNTTQISISLFEIPCSIFIIHYSLFIFSFLPTTLPAIWWAGSFYISGKTKYLNTKVRVIRRGELAEY